MLTANPNMYTITTVMTGGGGPGTTVTFDGNGDRRRISNTVFAGADVSNGAGANAACAGTRWARAATSPT